MFTRFRREAHLLASLNHHHIAEPDYHSNYDVSADRQQFLMAKASQQQRAATQIHVILNWFEERKQRAQCTRKSE